jgi:hypothetical protein
MAGAPAGKGGLVAGVAVMPLSGVHMLEARVWVGKAAGALVGRSPLLHKLKARRSTVC